MEYYTLALIPPPHPVLTFILMHTHTKLFISFPHVHTSILIDYVFFSGTPSHFSMTFVFSRHITSPHNLIQHLTTTHQLIRHRTSFTTHHHTSSHFHNHTSLTLSPHQQPHLNSPPHNHTYHNLTHLLILFPVLVLSIYQGFMCSIHCISFHLVNYYARVKGTKVALHRLFVYFCSGIGLDLDVCLLVSFRSWCNRSPKKKLNPGIVVVASV